MGLRRKDALHANTTHQRSDNMIVSRTSRWIFSIAINKDRRICFSELFIAFPSCQLSEREDGAEDHTLTECRDT